MPHRPSRRLRRWLRSASSAKVLVVIHRDEDLAWLSLRNVATVHAIAVDQLNAYDVLVADEVVLHFRCAQAYVTRGSGTVAEGASDEAEDASDETRGAAEEDEK